VGFPLTISVSLSKITLQPLSTLDNLSPHRRHPCFDVVVGRVWSNDPESYAGGSVATGRVSLAGQVKGDDPD
jgi:hypothetical protein